MNLLQQFIAEECNDRVRAILRDALSPIASARSTLEFNRFNVTVERDHDVVLIADILDATETGEQSIPIPAFAVAVASTAARPAVAL